jgi:hypothetical protein
MATKDWLEWHRQYDRPATGMAARLAEVQRHINAVLDQAPAGPIRVVSVCAGQGRDLLEVLPGHPRAGDVRARLVELDARNVALASAAAASAGLGQVEVVLGDASVTTAYEGAVPADLVLVCGVFGHASDDDIHRTVDLLAMLCAPGATVVWTRGGFQPDLRPTIRSWFTAAGFEDLGLTTGPGGRAGDWGVGVNRLRAAPAPYEPGVRLFTFVEDLTEGGTTLLSPPAGSSERRSPR